MLGENQIDFRKDQLKILALEEHSLKPMAMQVLDRKAGRHAKVGAIAATLLMMTSLNTASAECLHKANASVDAINASKTAHIVAIRDLNRLSTLVSEDASLDKIKPVLVNVFRLVDQEHQRLEAIVKSKNGKLLQRRMDPSAGGGGRKPDTLQWLMQKLT